MGQAKRLLEAQWEVRGLAEAALCAVGAIKACEFHEDIYLEGNGDVQAAYRLANARISRDDWSLPSYMSRRDLTDAIKQMYDELSCADGCWACAKAMRD
jgi:hypothetical protein